MSLLDAGNQPVTIFPEEETTDADDNILTRPSATGIETFARIDLMNQSGTSARRSEQDNEGFESEESYSLRPTRAFTAEHGLLGAQSQVEWRGVRWALFGMPRFYSRSPATAHVTYSIKRY